MGFPSSRVWSTVSVRFASPATGSIIRIDSRKSQVGRGLASSATTHVDARRGWRPPPKTGCTIRRREVIYDILAMRGGHEALLAVVAAPDVGDPSGGVRRPPGMLQVLSEPRRPTAGDARSRGPDVLSTTDVAAVNHPGVEKLRTHVVYGAIRPMGWASGLGGGPAPAFWDLRPRSPRPLPTSCLHRSPSCPFLPPPSYLFHPASLSYSPFSGEHTHDNTTLPHPPTPPPSAHRSPPHPDPRTMMRNTPRHQVGTA